jgi:hypothetical protein
MHSSEAPVRNKYNLLFRQGRGRQQAISEVTLGSDIEPDPAEAAGKKSVCFIERHRPTALRTLMFNFQ